MTYATLERSRHAGQPVELYRFSLGDTVDPDELVLPDTEYETGVIVAEEDWTYPSTAHVYDLGLAGPWPAFNPGGIMGGAPGGGTAGSFSMLGVFNGGGIGANGQAYHRRTFAGLDPAQPYLLETTITKEYATGWFHTGIQVEGLDTRPFVGGGAGATGVQIIGPPKADGTVVVSFGVFIAPFNAFVANPLDFTVGPITLSQPDLAIPPTSPGSFARLHYTSAEVPILFRGDTYEPAIFTRTAVRSGASEGLEAIELTMPRNHPVAQLFHHGLPVAPVTCTMYRVHRPDAAAGTSYITPFLGQVDRARFEGPACILTLASLRAGLERKHPRLLIQSRCPFMLYDSMCQVDREAHRFDTTVTAVDGFTLTLDGLAAEAGADVTRFQYGYLVAPSGEHVFIDQQNGDLVHALTPPRTLSPGDAVAVYWGCDRSTGDTGCSRFDNIGHFGGRPLLPQRNPFGPTGMIV